MLSGKNKEQFEEWYINDFLKIGHTKNLEEHRERNIWIEEILTQ